MARSRRQARWNGAPHTRIYPINPNRWLRAPRWHSYCYRGPRGLCISDEHLLGRPGAAGRDSRAWYALTERPAGDGRASRRLPGVSENAHTRTSWRELMVVAQTRSECVFCDGLTASAHDRATTRAFLYHLDITACRRSTSGPCQNHFVSALIAAATMRYLPRCGDLIDRGIGAHATIFPQRRVVTFPLVGSSAAMSLHRP